MWGAGPLCRDWRVPALSCGSSGYSELADGAQEPVQRAEVEEAGQRRWRLEQPSGCGVPGLGHHGRGERVVDVGDLVEECGEQLGCGTVAEQVGQLVGGCYLGCGLVGSSTSRPWMWPSVLSA